MFHAKIQIEISVISSIIALSASIKLQLKRAKYNIYNQTHL